MRKAAAQLNTTQPSVSRSIAALEAAVGVRLLDRNPEGVEPTEYGRALLGRRRGGVRRSASGGEEDRVSPDPEAGEVRIGSGHHHAASFVFVVVERLPGAIHVWCFIPPVPILRSFWRANSTLATWICWLRGNGTISDERLDFEHLFDDPNFVVAGTQHPLARRRRIECAELSKESWVLPPPESPPGAAAVEAFRTSGLSIPVSQNLPSSQRCGIGYWRPGASSQYFRIRCWPIPSCARLSGSCR